MIAPSGNGNGPLQRNGPSVMTSSTGQGTVRHYLEDSEYLASLEADALLASIRAHDGDPLICPCHADPFGNGPCRECRAEIDAMLVRRGLKPSGAVVDAGDGEPRDGQEDLT